MERLHEERSTAKARIDELLCGNEAPRARAVVEALLDARRRSTGFLLSCGPLPEVSESCTEALHDHVHALSQAHFDRQRALDDLRAALRQSGVTGPAFDAVDQTLTSLLAADTTAAYLFGLAAGLGLGSFDRRLAE